MEKTALLILIAFILTILPSAVSAEIMLSQPNFLYNIGDSMDISATIKPDKDVDGFLTLALSCGDLSKEFYKAPFSLKAGQEEKISTQLILSKSFLGEMIGECRVDANYGEDQSSTQSFQVTDKIDLIVNINNVNAIAMIATL